MKLAFRDLTQCNLVEFRRNFPKNNSIHLVVWRCSERFFRNVNILLSHYSFISQKALIISVIVVVTLNVAENMTFWLRLDNTSTDCINSLILFALHSTMLKSCCFFSLRQGTSVLKRILIIKANKIHYFSTLFWQRTLHISDRFTVHHQEFYYCIRSYRYFVITSLHLTESNYHHQEAKSTVHHTPRCKKQVST